MRILMLLLCVAFCGCSADNQKLQRKVIAAADAPKAIGPYSQAIQSGNILYLAGQIALDPQSGKMVDGGIEAQTHQVFKNIQAVLAEAGFGLSDVVQAQVFVTDMNHYGALNAIYATHFPQNPPARAVVEVRRLPADALVEIMMVAIK